MTGRDMIADMNRRQIFPRGYAVKIAVSFQLPEVARITSQGMWGNPLLKPQHIEKFGDLLFCGFLHD